MDGLIHELIFSAQFNTFLREIWEILSVSHNFTEKRVYHGIEGNYGTLSYQNSKIVKVCAVAMFFR